MEFLRIDGSREASRGRGEADGGVDAVDVDAVVAAQESSHGGIAGVARAVSDDAGAAEGMVYFV